MRDVHDGRKSEAKESASPASIHNTTLFSYIYQEGILYFLAKRIIFSEEIHAQL